MSCSSCNCDPCACTKYPYTVGTGSQLVFPAGTQLVQLPVGETPSTPSTPTSPEEEVPCTPCLGEISTEFTMPAAGAQSQFSSQFANVHIFAGDYVHFAGQGFVEVISVAGDIVTFENLIAPYGVAPGAVIIEGATFRVIPPLEQLPIVFDSAAIFNGACVPGELPAATQADAAFVCDAGLAKTLAPTADGQILYSASGKWTRRLFSDLDQSGAGTTPSSDYFRGHFSGTYATDTTDPRPLAANYAASPLEQGGYLATGAGDTITVPKTGIYYISFNAGVNPDPGTTQGNVHIGIALNGTVPFYRLTCNALVNVAANAAMSEIVSLNAGQTVRMMMRYLTAGGAPIAESINIWHPALSIIRIA